MPTPNRAKGKIRSRQQQVGTHHRPRLGQNATSIGKPRMSAYGYNLPFALRRSYVRNGPNSGPLSANVWNCVGYVRFTSRSGSAGRSRNTGRNDPKQSFAKTGLPQSRLRTILALCTCRAREAGHRNKGRSALGPKTRHELTFKLDQSDRADQWRIAESLTAAAHAESLGDKPKPPALATPPRGVDPDVDHQEAA